jgi:hypothetical protein
MDFCHGLIPDASVVRPQRAVYCIHFLYFIGLRNTIRQIAGILAIRLHSMTHFPQSAA